MPWTVHNAPPAMQGLAPAVRAKAVEIANALLRQGSDDGRAIRIGIAQAKAWASALQQTRQPLPDDRR
jgi:uncharacterized protein YdaT